MKKDKLQSLRKLKGFTQQQIADIIATDTSNYSRKESGDVRIYPEEWEKISRFLDTPIEEIYEDDNPLQVYASNNITELRIDKEATYLSIIQNLQDYIAVLKEENLRLKEKYPDKIGRSKTP